MPARSYQRGMKAYIDGSPLSGNPYDPSVCSKANSAWSDGWLDASRAWWRLRGREASWAGTIVDSSIQIDAWEPRRAK
jgi:hypothetical protein